MELKKKEIDEVNNERREGGGGGGEGNRGLGQGEAGEGGEKKKNCTLINICILFLLTLTYGLRAVLFSHCVYSQCEQTASGDSIG